MSEQPSTTPVDITATAAQSALVPVSTASMMSTTPTTTMTTTVTSPGRLEPSAPPAPEAAQKYILVDAPPAPAVPVQSPEAQEDAE